MLEPGRAASRILHARTVVPARARVAIVAPLGDATLVSTYRTARPASRFEFAGSLRTLGEVARRQHDGADGVGGLVEAREKSPMDAGGDGQILQSLVDPEAVPNPTCAHTGHALEHVEHGRALRLAAIGDGVLEKEAERATDLHHGERRGDETESGLELSDNANRFRQRLSYHQEGATEALPDQDQVGRQAGNGVGEEWRAAANEADRLVRHQHDVELTQQRLELEQELGAIRSSPARDQQRFEKEDLDARLLGSLVAGLNGLSDLS